MTPKARFFWPLLFVLVLTDCTTKDFAIERLDTPATPHEVAGSLLRFTLVHNPGTAFGFDLRPYLGELARPLLIAVMLAILAAMLRVYSQTPPRARVAAAALGLACGGAIGNLIDRFRFPLGVVDFIDVGIGAHRFWVFNIADAGISVGAATLACVLLREGSASAPSRPAV